MSRRCLISPCTPALHEEIAAVRDILKQSAAFMQPADPHSLTRDRRDVSRPAIACTGGYSQCSYP